MTTTTTTRIPLPVGADKVQDWEVNPDETVSRTFYGPRRHLHQVEITIIGEQSYSTGRALRQVANLYAGQYGVDLGETELRQVIAELSAIADALRSEPESYLDRLWTATEAVAELMSKQLEEDGAS
jgi:hypothetical protein